MKNKTISQCDKIPMSQRDNSKNEKSQCDRFLRVLYYKSKNHIVTQNSVCYITNIFRENLKFKN